MAATFRRSSLALAVLGLLDIRPLHPYGIQRLVKQWGKDDVVNVGQRATLYKVILRLAEAGLVRVSATSKDTNYPERTSYQVTEAGRDAAIQWLGEMLSTPRNEYPDFPVALSFTPMISAPELAEHLERRREALTAQVQAIRAGLAAAKHVPLPRAVLLDTEYRLEMTRAELKWVRAILDQLVDGSLTWDRDELDAMATGSGAY